MSAVLSLALYVAHRPYVVYVGNGVVDGAIGLAISPRLHGAFHPYSTLRPGR